MITFKIISTFTALLSFILFLILLFFPESIFILFQIEGSSSAVFVSRRASMLFLGIAALTWSGKNAVHTASRQSVCMGMATCMVGMGIIGTFEFVKGNTGIGIVPAILTEWLVGASYFRIWFVNRRV